MLEPPVSVSRSQTSKSRKLSSQPKQRLVIEKAHEPYQEKELPRIEIEKGEKAEPVPRDLLEQWDRGNRAMRRPTYVQGDNIKERVKEQIYAELQVKGIKPYEFDYRDSNVMALQQMEQRKLPTIAEVMSNEKPAWIKSKPKTSVNKSRISRASRRHAQANE